MKTKAPVDSAWSLTQDVLSARMLVWVASVGREAELTREAEAIHSD